MFNQAACLQLSAQFAVWFCLISNTTQLLFCHKGIEKTNQKKTKQKIKTEFTVERARNLANESSLVLSTHTRGVQPPAAPAAGNPLPSSSLYGHWTPSTWPPTDTHPQK